MNYIVKSGVIFPSGLKPKIKKIADAYYALTKKKITITDGSRMPKDQAKAMFSKIKKESLKGLDIYSNKKALNEIKQAYVNGLSMGKSESRIIADMASVIKKQVSRNVYISRHLLNKSVDVRTRDMQPAEFKIFMQVASGIAKKVLPEGDHYHLSF